MAELGFDFGPVFRGLSAAWRHGTELLTEAILPSPGHGDATTYLLHPALADAAQHAATPALLRELTQTCPETAELARLHAQFAQLPAPAEGNDTKLTDRITAARAAGLPQLHSFCNGLELDRAAVDAGLTLPYHNGRTEGVITRTTAAPTTAGQTHRGSNRRLTDWMALKLGPGPR